MHPSRSRLCHGLHRLVVAAAIGLVFQASAVSAQEVQQLIRQGLYPQALEQIDRQLADKPRDAQIRFMRGVVLTEMGRTQEAVAVFNRLTEDYPELPEPYNNLAVIYAQQKQYDKARQALEKAIRTHPAYATAHENLGDIYATPGSDLSKGVILVRAAPKGVDPTKCMPPNYQGCVVAKRTFAFRESETEQLPIKMLSECIGEACHDRDNAQTCVQGRRCVGTDSDCEDGVCTFPRRTETPTAPPSPGGPGRR